MKITATNFYKNVNNSSSWICYIVNSKKVADNLYTALLPQSEMLKENGWYHHVSMNTIASDCRVPEFFHHCDYILVCVEHNNGDWDKEPTYKLYIVEE